MARRSNNMTYWLGMGVGDSIQNAIVPRIEFRFGAAATVIWFCSVPSKLITPSRPSWLGTHVAPTLTPLFPAGELSTITSACGSASNANCTTNSGRTVQVASAEVTAAAPGEERLQ